MAERFAVNEDVVRSSRTRGAIQNKKQNQSRLRRQGAENPQGFSRVFARKLQARDPAKGGD